MEKKLTVIIKIILALILAYVVFYSNKDTKDGIRNEWRKYFKEISYSGPITKKFFDEGAKHSSAIIVNQTMFYLFNKEIYNEINVGDTLIKEKGTLKHLYIKNGDTIIFYPVCLNKTLKDDDR